MMAGSDMLIMSGLMGMYPILFSVTGIPFSVFKSFLSSVIINLKKIVPVNYTINILHFQGNNV
jgi:hypothetical protein